MSSRDSDEDSDEERDYAEFKKRMLNEIHVIEQNSNTRNAFEELTAVLETAIKRPAWAGRENKATSISSSSTNPPTPSALANSSWKSDNFSQISGSSSTSPNSQDRSNELGNASVFAEVSNSLGPGFERHLNQRINLERYAGAPPTRFSSNLYAGQSSPSPTSVQDPQRMDVSVQATSAYTISAVPTVPIIFPRSPPVIGARYSMIEGWNQHSHSHERPLERSSVLQTEPTERESHTVENSNSGQSLSSNTDQNSGSITNSPSEIVSLMRKASGICEFLSSFRVTELRQDENFQNSSSQTPLSDSDFLSQVPLNRQLSTSPAQPTETRPDPDPLGDDDWEDYDLAQWNADTAMLNFPELRFNAMSDSDSEGEVPSFPLHRNPAMTNIHNQYRYGRSNLTHETAPPIRPRRNISPSTREFYESIGLQAPDDKSSSSNMFSDFILMPENPKPMSYPSMSETEIPLAFRDIDFQYDIGDFKRNTAAHQLKVTTVATNSKDIEVGKGGVYKDLGDKNLEKPSFPDQEPAEEGAEKLGDEASKMAGSESHGEHFKVFDLVGGAQPSVLRRFCNRISNLMKPHNTAFKLPFSKSCKQIHPEETSKLRIDSPSSENDETKLSKSKLNA